MKRNIFLSLVITGVLLLSGCGQTNVVVKMNGDVKDQLSIAKFVEICDAPITLDYDPVTRIVYIKNYTYGMNYTYTPYYAPNGLPYRYNAETNTFEEINNDKG